MPALIPPEILARVQEHLGTPPSSTDAHSVLAAHLPSLPPSLARDVGATLTPQERARIPGIKARRVLYALGGAVPGAGATSTASPTTSPATTARTLPLGPDSVPLAPRPPVELQAESGRRRWPLLWERLGGDARVLDATPAQTDEARWASDDFMPSRARGDALLVGRLGRMLAEEEEVREWEEARAARGRERRLDAVGEEFDDEDDDDDDEDMGAGGGVQQQPMRPTPAGVGVADQAAVVAVFERQLRELFIDGLDSLDYDPIDFADPADGVDPIAARDAEDAWFDDEPPSSSNGGAGNGAGHGVHAMENGQGDYDY